MGAPEWEDVQRAARPPAKTELIEGGPRRFTPHTGLQWDPHPACARCGKRATSQRNFYKPKSPHPTNGAHEYDAHPGVVRPIYSLSALEGSGWRPRTKLQQTEAQNPDLLLSLDNRNTRNLNKGVAIRPKGAVNPTIAIAKIAFGPGALR